MHIQRRFVVAVFIAALSGGDIVEGQNREKIVEAPIKNPGAKKADSQVVQKAVENGKKSAEAVKKPEPLTKVKNGKTTDDPEEKSIRDSAEAFARLYCEHDAKGLSELFAPKAEMIDEDGRVVKGREEIEKTYSDLFKSSPSTSMTVDIESIRVITPVLAIEEGTTQSKDSPDDPVDESVYVVIHVKLDGKWRLACVREWDAPAKELTPHDHLQQDLAWLIGDWVDESPDSVVNTVCKWNDNGNFLMQEFQVNVGGLNAMSGTMRIGWDAVAKQFKSWVFDSHGGHATGAWSWNGDRWIVKLQGATAKGEVGSSTNYYRQVDADTIAWGSSDRIVNGERLEDVSEIIVKRRPPSPNVK